MGRFYAPLERSVKPPAKPAARPAPPIERVLSQWQPDDPGTAMKHYNEAMDVRIAP
jgi:hypothetical protein